MNEGRIFCYIRMGAWVHPCHRVEVWESVDGGTILCKENDSEPIQIEIDGDVIREIKQAMKSNLEIYQYQEIEMPNSVYDGFSNLFDFAPEKDLKVYLHADNMGFVEKPDCKWMIWEGSQTTKDVHPYRALAVAKVFYKIADILRRNGVEEQYLKL